MRKKSYPKLMDKRIYESYYDFCNIYEPICEMVNDVIGTPENDSGYAFINCLGRYIDKRKKEGSKKDKALIAKNDFYPLIPEEIWEEICYDAEDWLGGLDHSYQDMISDCLGEILSKRFIDIPEGRKICNGCTNQIKCQMVTK